MNFFTSALSKWNQTLWLNARLETHPHTETNRPGSKGSEMRTILGKWVGRKARAWKWNTVVMTTKIVRMTQSHLKTISVWTCLCLKLHRLRRFPFVFDFLAQYPPSWVTLNASRLLLHSTRGRKQTREAVQASPPSTKRKMEMYGCHVSFSYSLAGGGQLTGRRGLWCLLYLYSVLSCVFFCVLLNECSAMLRRGEPW